MAERQATAEILDRRSVAIRRLDQLQDLSKFDGDIIRFVLNQYGYHKKDIKDLGHQKRFDLAMRLLNEDLLLSNSYEPNGQPSKYLYAWNKLNGREIDPQDYVYIGSDPRTTSLELAKHCPAYTDAPDADTIIERYIWFFKERGIEDLPLIIMPGQIFINQESDAQGIYLASSDSFIPPYGERDENKTVYRHKYHRIGIPKPK